MPGSAPTRITRHILPRLYWLLALLLILAPAVAMRLTDQVDWQAEDFLAFGIMLLIPGLALELVTRKRGPGSFRTGVGLAMAAAFFLVWVNGAVGLIGAEDNPANLMYGGVLGVAVLGAAISRLRPRGMAMSMLAAAVAQALVLVIALLRDAGRGAPSWPTGTITGTVFFVVLWCAAAFAFRQADHHAGEAGGR